MCYKSFLFLVHVTNGIDEFVYLNLDNNIIYCFEGKELIIVRILLVLVIEN